MSGKHVGNFLVFSQQDVVFLTKQFRYTVFGFFIIHNALKIASTEEKFIQLLEHIASIDNGIHLTIPLHSIYEENLDLAIKIYKKIVLAEAAAARFVHKIVVNLIDFNIYNLNKKFANCYYCHYFLYTSSFRSKSIL